MTMEHTEAIDTGAAERYALGEMNESERDQYEEHFFDCPDCADEVKAATLFLENAKAVVREDHVSSETEDLERVAAARMYRAAAERPRWTAWKALFWPMPLGAAAALVALLGGPTAYLAFFKVPQLERTIAADQALQPAPSYFLSVSRSEPPVVTVQEHERRVILTLSKSSDQSFPFYRCEVKDSSGRALLSNVVPAPPQQDELQILLHTEKLPAGAYVLAVAGLESASAPTATPSAEYHFTLRRAGRGE